MSTWAAVAASATPGITTEPASENSTLPRSRVVPEKIGAAARGSRPEICAPRSRTSSPDRPRARERCVAVCADGRASVKGEPGLERVEGTVAVQIELHGRQAWNVRCPGQNASCRFIEPQVQAEALPLRHEPQPRRQSARLVQASDS